MTISSLIDLFLSAPQDIVAQSVRITDIQTDVQSIQQVVKFTKGYQETLLATLKLDYVQNPQRFELKHFSST
jgi:hypothetical protein